MGVRGYRAEEVWGESGWGPSKYWGEMREG